MRLTSCFVMALAVAAGMAAQADTAPDLAHTGATVTDVTAKQRYPWNGLVDITCTVSGIDENAHGPDLTLMFVDPDTGNARYASQFWSVRGGTKTDDVSVPTNGEYRLLWDARADLGQVFYSNMVVRVGFDARGKVRLWEGGPCWAETNIGAEDPWDSGLYFWWGDTIGYARGDNCWVASDGSNTNFLFGTNTVLTCNKGESDLKSAGWITSSKVLPAEHDAARAHWGGKWRMPTKQELTDLTSKKCTWKTNTVNGVSGYVVSGTGVYENVSIFLPFAGKAFAEALQQPGVEGRYWSTAWGSKNYAYQLGTTSKSKNVVDYSLRYGFTIRPVKTAAYSSATGGEPTPAGQAGDSAPFRLDTTDETRESDGNETLPYSSLWDGDANATVTIALNGEAIEDATELVGEGEYVWRAPHAGTYTFTHTTYMNGVAGKVETVTFEVGDMAFADGDIELTGYEGVYDGEGHGIVVVTNAIPGLELRYATAIDGEFSEVAPLYTNVCEETVWVEASAPGYITTTYSATVKITSAEEDDSIDALAVGKYFKATLAKLGYDVPTNGTPYSVKAYGLPAGLKLKHNAAWKNKKGKVVVKAKSEWWIVGVPKAALDFATNPPYLVIMANGKTKTVPLRLEVAAQKVTELEDLALGQSLNEPFYLPGVTNGWTVSGLPTGLKYTAKRITAKLKSGKKKRVVTKALPYSVYGKTTAAGLFTITAKKKKGAYYETMKYRVLVTPKPVDTALFGDLTNITTMAYVPLNWNLESGEAVPSVPSVPFVPSAVGGKVAKVAGLPTGLTFAASTTYKDKKKKQVKQAAQTIVGTPTKPGTYVVTFTKNVTTGTGKNKKTVAKTAQILWKVVANDAELSLGFNTSGGVVEGGVVGLNYGDLLAFSATDGAKVTASGLPAGITLANLGSGNYAFTGFTAKAGTYLVTVTATQNGKTVRQRVALKVEGLPVWAKGTFNGTVYATGETPVVPENGQDDRSPCGLATITVSSVGKISGKFYEGGTNWTLSAASYTAATSAAAPAFICSNVVATYTYKVTKTVKGKKKKVTQKATRTFALTVSPVSIVPNVPIVPDVPTRGLVQMVEDGEAATAITACQNIWGRAAYKSLGKKLFYTSKKKQYKTFAYGVYTNETGSVCFAQKGEDTTGLTSLAALSLTVTPAGAVTATLSFDTGKKAKNKKTGKMEKVYFKPTCSTVVIPTSAADADPFTGDVPLFFAPSPGNNFPGFGGWMSF